MLLEKFKGKSVLVTGHTGFKGSWLVMWLRLLGAKVTGVALDPPSFPVMYDEMNITSEIDDRRFDISNYELLKKTICDVNPDFIFHLAAQSLVHKSYSEPFSTWNTNVIGSIHILEAVKSLEKTCAVVMITSDKCYENVEWVWGYREDDRLGGLDPYSASKSAAEIAIRSYVHSYFPKSNSKVRIASARAGNVIGGGDWAENRIIPDCIRSWANNEVANIRNPDSTRPWQHVLEPLSGYLHLAIELFDRGDLHGEAFNFGPPSNQCHDVRYLVDNLARHWNGAIWESGILSPGKANHEAGLLKLNCDKALSVIGWHPAMDFNTTLQMTAEWYKAFYADNQSIRAKTEDQINEYVMQAKLKELRWAI